MSFDGKTEGRLTLARMASSIGVFDILVLAILILTAADMQGGRMKQRLIPSEQSG